MQDSNNSTALGVEDEKKTSSDHSADVDYNAGHDEGAEMDSKPAAAEELRSNATAIDAEQPALEDAQPAPIDIEQEYFDNEQEGTPIDIEQEYFDEAEPEEMDSEPEEMDSKPAAIVAEQDYAEQGDYYEEDSKPAAINYDNDFRDQEGHVNEANYDGEAYLDGQVDPNQAPPSDVQQEYYDESEYYEEDLEPVEATENEYNNEGEGYEEEFEPAAVVTGENEYVEQGDYFEADSKPAAVYYDNEYVEQGEYDEEEAKPAAVPDENDYVDSGEYFEEVTKSLANESGFIYVSLPDGTKAKVRVDDLQPVQDTGTSADDEFEQQAVVYAPEEEMTNQPFYGEAADEYPLQQQSDELYIEQNDDGVLGVPTASTETPELEQPVMPEYENFVEDGMMGVIPEDESRAFSVEGSAQPTLKDPPLPTVFDDAEGANDEEIGLSSGYTSPENNIRVPMGPASDEKLPMTTNGHNGEGEEQPKKKKREINPDFKDLQSTGKWGTISRNETIFAGVVSALVVIGVIVALSVVLTRDSTTEETVPANTLAPTPAATPIPANQRFSVLFGALKSNNVTTSIADAKYSDDLSKYEGLIGPDGGCASSAHNCAMSWALFEDDFPPDNNNIIERFAMATLFYALGGNAWKNSTNWLSTKSYCEWYGIKCNRGAIFAEEQAYIEDLDLDDNNLVGEIPLELSLVDTIRAVSLKANTITGELPGGVFGSMSELFVLYIQNNQLTGTIPDNLRNSNNMAMLFLQENNFTGPYPSAYCDEVTGPVFQEFGLDCEQNECPSWCCISLNCY